MLRHQAKYNILFTLVCEQKLISPQKEDEEKLSVEKLSIFILVYIVGLKNPSLTGQ